MTFPLLRVARGYAHVEVRRGRGAQRWEDMAEVFSGAATKGQEWKGGEGDKLSARHCMWPSDPSSTLSLPYSVSGTEGLGTGLPETLVFPSGVSSLLGSAIRLFTGAIGGHPDQPPAHAAAQEEGEGEEPTLLLHEDPRSGNCYKIKLTAALLGLPLATRQYDILKGETRTPDFMARVNANGRIPVLQIGNHFLPESNAACWYLAEGSELIPEDRFARADMLRWMFFEQYNHEPNIATLRFWLQFVGEANLSPQQQGQIMAKRAAGEEALRLMDEHLAAHDWFVGGAPSLADIALYAYTHVAEAGGFLLRDHPAVCRWLDRVTRLPRFVPMG